MMDPTKKERQMNMRMTSLVAIAAAMSLTAGCATRRNVERPVDPPTTTEVSPNDGQGNDGSQEGGPGSRADFLRSVPADRVFFELDSYSIDAQDRTTLDAQAGWLQQYPNVRVTIEGHADERGTREYNLALGDRRANAARDYLQSRGITPERMTTISWGKERPQNPASNEEAWAQNRRAVTVVPQ
jgi:peptidoglycan-associated lipoprotein